MSLLAETDPERAETALRASERRFRDLVESIPHLIWTCTGDGACDYLSPQWIAYTGLPEAGQLGYGWLEQIHPADRDECDARWAVAAVTGGVFDIQMRIRRGDGSYRWFQTRGTPVRDDAGRISKWFGSNTDIQELRDAQAATVGLTDDLETRVLARTEDLRAINAELASVAHQLKDAQRVAEVGSWEFDVASHCVVWSEQLYRIIGLDPQCPPLDYHAQEAIYTPASWALLAASVQRIIAQAGSYELTLEMLRPDGERRTVIARGEAVQGTTGVVEKLVGTLQNVTELARMRGALATLSERTQIATSAANLGVWEWSLADDTLVWDATMHRLYDTAPGEFSGAYEAWQSRIHPDDRAATESELQDALAGLRDFQTEFRIVWKNGEVRHLRPAAAVQRDVETGRPVRVIGVNWDITEQRRVETALRSSEALQRGILAHAGSAIIASDLAGRISLFNGAAEELLGYTADELIGQTTPISFHAVDQVDARRVVLERELGVRLGSARDVVLYSARQGKPETHEWAYLRKDGTRVPVLLTVSALRDDAGAIVGYFGVALDLTRRKQDEAALVELNRLLAERSAQAESASHAKTMFLANMSHEIRTPINAITGVSYLLNRAELSAEQRDLVRTLNSATKTLLGMINDVLDLSKIEAQQLTLDEGPFRLSQLVDDLRAMTTVLAAEKQLQLVFETDPAAPEHLIGDSMRLTQVLTNLVGNAIKFTAAGAVGLAIRVVAGDGARTWLRFEVRDSGPGIDEDLLPRLFTPFTQADHPGARRAGGTGLGLAIVRQLATLMGGEVGVTSNLGEGSEFWCRIPFAEVARERRGSSPPSLRRRTSDPITTVRGMQRLSGTRLLVVDDSKLNQIVVCRILEREGGRVDCADDGLDAVARVRAAPAGYDAVLMDVQMPVLDGIEATRRIRSLAGCASLPILAVTAGALAAERRLALDAGVNDVISKPFDPEVVIASIRKYIKRVRGHSVAIPLALAPRVEWPAIDGIDARDAERRLGGDLATFGSLLGVFAGSLAAAEHALSTASTDPTGATLAQQLHALRGTAGNLGARDLHAATAAAERWVRARIPDRARDGVQGVRAQIARLRGAIAGFLASAAADRPRPPTVACTEIIDAAALASFMQRLEDHDMDASTSPFAQSPALAAALGDREHARMCSLLDRLDFEAAFQIVRTVAQPREPRGLAAPT